MVGLRQRVLNLTIRAYQGPQDAAHGTVTKEGGPDIPVERAGLLIANWERAPPKERMPLAPPPGWRVAGALCFAEAPERAHRP